MPKALEELLEERKNLCCELLEIKVKNELLKNVYLDLIKQIDFILYGNLINSSLNNVVEIVDLELKKQNQEYSINY